MQTGLQTPTDLCTRQREISVLVFGAFIEEERQTKTKRTGTLHLGTYGEQRVLRQHECLRKRVRAHAGLCFEEVFYVICVRNVF